MISYTIRDDPSWSPPIVKYCAKLLYTFLCPIPTCQVIGISISAANYFTLSWSANLRSKLSYRAYYKRKIATYHSF